MSLNNETAVVLKAGTMVGLCIMAIGLLLSSFDFGDTVIAAGTLILVLTPMAGVLVSTKCLIQEKDRYWVRIAIVLIIVIIIGATISYLK